MPPRRNTALRIIDTHQCRHDYHQRHTDIHGGQRVTGKQESGGQHKAGQNDGHVSITQTKHLEHFQGKGSHQQGHPRFRAKQGAMAVEGGPYHQQ